MNDTTEHDPRLYAIPDIHGHAKGEHKPYAEERPLPLTARMLFLWFYHACRRGYPRFLMVADHMNYLTFEDPAAVNLVRRALKLAQAGDLYGAAETANVDVGHAAVVSEGLRRGMRFSIGAEVDNDPRSRPDAQNIVDAMRPDAIIRSVHFIPITHPVHGENWNWPFDNPEFAELFEVVGTDALWESYVTTLVDAIERLPGHIVGHFYVPAVFGHWPDDAKLSAYEDRVLAAAGARGMAIEFNTRFLYRDHPDEEKDRYLRANRRLLKKAKERGVQIAIGSDAHSPRDQGNGFEIVLQISRRARHQRAGLSAGRLAAPRSAARRARAGARTGPRADPRRRRSGTEVEGAHRRRTAGGKSGQDRQNRRVGERDGCCRTGTRRRAGANVRCRREDRGRRQSCGRQTRSSRADGQADREVHRSPREAGHAGQGRDESRAGRQGAGGKGTGRESRRKNGAQSSAQDRIQDGTQAGREGEAGGAQTRAQADPGQGGRQEDYTAEKDRQESAAAQEGREESDAREARARPRQAGGQKSRREAARPGPCAREEIWTRKRPRDASAQDRHRQEIGEEDARQASLGVIRLRILAFGALACALCFTGCSKAGTDAPGGSPGAPVRGVLRVATQRSPNTLNPLLSANTTEGFINRLSFDTLVSVDGSGKNTVPILATVVPTLQNGGISKDGLTITYHLHRSVRWQDGQPFSSKDVKFSWQAMMNNANNVNERVGYDQVASVDTPDATTVVFHLKRRFAPFVEYRLRRERQPGRDRPGASAGAVSEPEPNAVQQRAGRYRPVQGLRAGYAATTSSWSPTTITSAANRNCARSSCARFPTNTSVNALRAATSTGSSNSRRVLPSVKGIPTSRSSSTSSRRRSSMLMNKSHPPLDDLRVRRAIAYAIDKKALVDKNSGGTAVVAWADQPPFQWSYTDDVMKYPPIRRRRAPRSRRPATRPGPTACMRKNGQPLSLSLSDNVENKTRQLVAVAIQSMLSAVGIDAPIKTFPANMLFATYGQGGDLDQREVRPQRLGLDRGPGSGRPFAVRLGPDPAPGVSRRGQLHALRAPRWTPRSARPWGPTIRRRVRRPT